MKIDKRNNRIVSDDGKFSVPYYWYHPRHTLECIDLRYLFIRHKQEFGDEHGDDYRGLSKEVTEDERAFFDEVECFIKSLLKGGHPKNNNVDETNVEDVLKRLGL